MFSLSFRVSCSLEESTVAAELSWENQPEAHYGMGYKRHLLSLLRQSSQWNIGTWLMKDKEWQRGRHGLTSEDCVAVFPHVSSPFLATVVLSESSSVDQYWPGCGCHIGNGCCLYVAQGLWFVGYLHTTQIHIQRAIRKIAVPQHF